MSAHVLMNLLNGLRKSDKTRGLPSILLLFRNEINKFNDTEHDCYSAVTYQRIKVTDAERSEKM